MSMPAEYMDYVLSPIDKKGKVVDGLANMYMVDRNSYFYLGGDLGYDWQSDVILADARESTKAWNIYLSHYPTYSSETKFNIPESGGISKSMDLDFAGNNIDLVIGAHVHNYERFDIPGKGQYIVNGNGGYNTFYTDREQVWADYVRLYGSGLNWDFSKKPSMPGLAHADDALFGFGWIDMDKTRLVYTQYVLDLPLVKTWDLTGDALKVNGDLSRNYLRVSDQLILNKTASPTVLKTDLASTAKKPNLSTVFASAPEVNVLTNYRLDAANGYGDIFVDNYSGDPSVADPVHLQVAGGSVNQAGDVVRMILGQASTRILIEAESGVFIDDVQDHMTTTADPVGHGRHVIQFDGARGNDGPQQTLPSDLEVLFRGGKWTIDSLAGLSLVNPLNNYISVGPSDDVIVGSSLNDFVRAGDGNDDVVLNGGSDLVELGAGVDFLRLNNSKVSLILRNDLTEDSTYNIYDWGRNDSLFLEDGLSVVSGLGSRELTLKNDRGYILTISSLEGKEFGESQFNQLYGL
jgi:hypothetical protein